MRFGANLSVTISLQLIMEVKDGKQLNFAAIIVRRDHPDLESILQTFDETIQYFKGKP